MFSISFKKKNPIVYKQETKENVNKGIKYCFFSMKNLIPCF